VPKSKGQALADEYGIKFFETVSESLSQILNLMRTTQTTLVVFILLT